MGRAERRASERNSQKQANRTGRPVRSVVTGEVFDPLSGQLLGGQGRVTAPKRAAQVRRSAAARASPPGGLPGPEAPSRAPEGRVSPAGRPPKPAAVNLADAVRRRWTAEGWVGRRVVEARAAGMSWREIGAVLGVSHVSALRRYGAEAATELALMAEWDAAEFEREPASPAQRKWGGS